MLFRVFLLLALLPLADLALLVLLAWQTSWMVVLTAVLVPGVIGAFLVRWVGPRRVRSAGRRIAQDHAPAAELLDGVFIIVAGVLLISPGVLTDVAGVSLLVPRVRRFVQSRLSRTVHSRIVKVVSAIDPSVSGRDAFGDGPIVDVESKPPRS